MTGRADATGWLLRCRVSRARDPRSSSTSRRHPSHRDTTRNQDQQERDTQHVGRKSATDTRSCIGVFVADVCLADDDAMAASI